MSSMPPNAEAAVGAVLNQRYRLVRLVGEGGLAAVYEAHDQKANAVCAIKLLHPQFTDQQNIVERFYTEAKSCFSLQHPHIADVHAYDYAEDGTPYIVMELLVGCSLEEYLRVNKVMTVEQAAPLIYGVLEALGVAHAAGLVHRDLKPANLFLVPDGSGGYTVKVLDFGIAKVLDAAGGFGTKTQTGAILGTPGYMSPEQIMDAKQVDPRTDLWALGVVFYEMLAGQHPYGDDNLNRVLTILKEQHAPLSQSRPELRAWDGFFQRALAREITHRFESAAHMQASLQQLAAPTPAQFAEDGLQTVAIPLVKIPEGRQTPAPVAASTTYRSAHASSHPPHLSDLPPSPAVASAPVSPVQARSKLGTMPSYQAAAGPAYAPAPGANTHISGAPSPAGIPVQVYAAPDEGPVMVPWWATLLIALIAFGAGMFCGYVVAGG